MNSTLILYRDIRRLHRKLPIALRIIGNKYIKEEFQKHKTADRQFVERFVNEWSSYRSDLQIQIRNDGIGKKLDQSQVDQMNEGQIDQLYNLYQSTKPSK